jgi:hypothetical protein
LNDYSLYLPYCNIKDTLTNDNCYNLNNKLVSLQFINKDYDILKQLNNLNREYIVLKQFWSVYSFRDFVCYDIHTHIKPSKEIMDIYLEIKNTILQDEPYNCIHYRYEHDFTSHFNITVDSLANIINKTKFNNNNIKTFIATSNIQNILDINNDIYKNSIVYKNDFFLMRFNFEQRAFIDYTICLNSVECYGHKNSSFSNMINNIKGTNNYY